MCVSTWSRRISSCAGRTSTRAAQQYICRKFAAFGFGSLSLYDLRPCVATRNGLLYELLGFVDSRSVRSIVNRVQILSQYPRRAWSGEGRKFGDARNAQNGFLGDRWRIYDNKEPSRVDAVPLRAARLRRRGKSLWSNDITVDAGKSLAEKLNALLAAPPVGPQEWKDDQKHLPDWADDLNPPENGPGLQSATRRMQHMGDGG